MFKRFRINLGGKIPVNIEENVDQPVVLLASVYASGFTVRPVASRVLKINGKRGKRGEVSLKIEDDPELGKVARLEASACNIEVNGPIRGMAITSKASGILVKKGEKLDFISIDSTSSSIRLDVVLAEGGGVKLRGTSSGVKVRLDFEKPGQYWIDIDMKATGVKIETPNGASYLLEEKEGRALNIKVEKPRLEAPKYFVKARIRGSALGVKLS